MPGSARQASGFPHLLGAWDFLHRSGVEITLLFREKGDELRDMVRSLYRRYIPNLILRFVREGEDASGRTAIKGRPTAWVCAGGACRPPAVGPVELDKTLDEALRPASNPPSV